jgi:hypothetical protein
VIVIEADMGAPDALSRMLDTLEAACERAKPFALAVIPTGDVPPPEQRRGRGGRVKQLLRLKAMRSRLTEQCAGIAMVVDPDEPENRKRIRGAQKAFGCPVLAFKTLAPAEAWLRAQLDVMSGALK